MGVSTVPVAHSAAGQNAAKKGYIVLWADWPGGIRSLQQIIADPACFAPGGLLPKPTCTRAVRACANAFGQRYMTGQVVGQCFCSTIKRIIEHIAKPFDPNLLRVCVCPVPQILCTGETWSTAPQGKL